MARTALLVIAIAIASTCVAEAGEPEARTLIAFALPSRRAEAKELAARCERIGELVATRLGASYRSRVRSARTDDLRAAYALFKQGSLDEAALAFDRAIEAAVEVVYELEVPAELVEASLARASIAGARNEP